MGLFSASKIYIIAVITITIAYITGQMKKEQYTKDNAIFLTTMLVASLVGLILLSFLRLPIIIIIVYIITLFPMVIATTILYN